MTRHDDDIADGERPAARAGLGAIFLIFLRLGLTSFGGPVAHLSYFRREFVERRRWLDEEAYAGIVALCQFLPGPASSQVGMALGLMRGGLAGALAAFIGFTAPSAVLMTGFAFLLTRLGDVAHAGWVHGLKLAAVAIVAQAVWSMARSLTPDLPRAGFAIAAAAAMLLLPFDWTQMAVIALAALLGFALLPADARIAPPLALKVPRALSAASLALFFLLLAGLPLASRASHAAAVFEAFYRSGALVFGGGHVVLPLLQRAVADPGWIDRAPFLAGYGAAQAMPGPLFSFAAFLGAALKSPPNGIAGAGLALGAIYLPSLLLILGVTPLWGAVQSHRGFARAVKGVNAAVVGLLGAALYTPVFTGAVFAVSDAVIAGVLFVLLVWRNTPPWAVVALAVACAVIVGRI
jgi:chromate transporter